MNLLAWNCRRLGNLRIEKELVSILRAKDPSVVFIAKTWVEEVRLDRTLSYINFDQKWVVPRTTRGGGLVLFWKNSVNLKVVGSHRYYIDAVINKNERDEWRFTGFYGEPDAAKRNEAWAKLRSLNSNQNIPWLCVGDYNEITRQEEKRSGVLRSFNQMQLFRDVIDECGLMDLGFVGPKYSWSKHFESGQSIWERLDKGLAMNNWFLLFPDPSSAILKKVAKCEQDLTWWNNNCFGNVRRTLADKKKLLAAAELEAMRSGNNSQVQLLKAEVNVLIHRESRLWSQRSRVLWLSKGDSNTNFFHSKATKRLQKNSILGIRDLTRRWLNQSEDIGQAFINYYTELFSSCPASQCGALDKIPQVVTEEMNADLVGVFHEWEILDAIKQMVPLKAPGPGRMPPLFYQHFWPMVDKDVTSSVLMWLNSVLANRLKKFLPNLITEHQLAFAKDQLITDNILVVFETLHRMKNQTSGKTGFMALKLDMSKAYDRIEWTYLETLMLKMGFCAKWISLIMACVRSVTYSTLINGAP
ncbi:uncharacterized protein LOC126693745 [Quercus robur]|uniref:uncharacterized protein LOC126693745 n=1 Tax=Quercus robur TaxID=38942 RepID=UPI00216369D7|nr:uncharacterized protein LOC126693745 [Quercus robur]